MKIILEGHEITGTPVEIVELLELVKKPFPPPFDPAPEPKAPEQPKPKPKAKHSPKTRQIDWNKAKALRDAGWSFAKIGDELGVSDVTVAAHLKQMK